MKRFMTSNQTTDRRNPSPRGTALSMALRASLSHFSAAAHCSPVPRNRHLSLCLASALVGLTTLFAGCREDAAYKNAVQSGRTTIPYVKEFERLYPDANHFITHYNIKGGARQWESQAFLYDRYEVVLQIPGLVFDATDQQVIGWGTPKFFAIETVKVDTENRSIHHGQGVQFGPDEWKNLVDAKGDLGSVGIKANKTEPVPGFELVKQGAR